jgi:hypothetical protein
MVPESERVSRLSVIVPSPLHACLQGIAAEEMTSIAAVARRLIAAGLAATRDDPRTVHATASESARG